MNRRGKRSPGKSVLMGANAWGRARHGAHRRELARTGANRHELARIGANLRQIGLYMCKSAQVGADLRDTAPNALFGSQAHAEPLRLPHRLASSSSRSKPQSSPLRVAARCAQRPTAWPAARRTAIALQTATRRALCAIRTLSRSGRHQRVRAPLRFAVFFRVRTVARAAGRAGRAAV